VRREGDGSPDIGEETLQSLVRNYEPTWFGVAGPILSRIAPELLRGTASDKARRNFIAPKNAANLTRLTGSPTHHIFGMTEGVIMFTRPEDPSEIREQSIGYPVSDADEVRIVHPGTEDPVADGEVGEALFGGRTPSAAITSPRRKTLRASLPTAFTAPVT
jgi:acyl-CoA synthetase (AMP-forming)/AMP-acid ligase II